MLLDCASLRSSRTGQKKRRMSKIDMRRGFGICKGTAKGDTNCLSVEAKFGRWQRSQNSVYVCCGFILFFFAVVTALSYCFEPSILIVDQLQPLSWRQGTDEVFGSQGVSVTENRRILSGGLATPTLELQQDVAEVHQRESDSISKQLVQRGNSFVTQIEDDESHTDGSNESNPLGLAADIRIFVYDLPSEYNIDWLKDSRCANHLFAAEVALHQILLKSPIRTLNPDAADFFFVPVYVSCNFSPKNGFPNLTNASTMIRAAVDFISREMIFWNRNGGRDHIFVATHDFGACFHAMEDLAVAAGVPEFLRQSIILQTFGQKDGHPCQEVEHIVIPPYVPPEVVQTHWAPVEKQERDIFAHFRGKLELHPKNVSGHFYSKGIRTRLWQRFKKSEQFFLRRKRLEGYQLEMLRSKFCLAPLGWAPWSPRIVESVVFGCVPVIIADNIALPHSHIIDWPNISLTVRERDVEHLERILLLVAATNLTAIQQNLWKEENRLAVLFNQPLLRGDASWHVFDLLAQKKVLQDLGKALLPHESIFGEIEENQSAGEPFRFTSV